MISLQAVVIKFFLLLVIIVYQYVPVRSSISYVVLPTNNPGCTVSMNVSLSISAVLLHQRPLGIDPSMLLLLHLIDDLLLLLAQVHVVPCHY